MSTPSRIVRREMIGAAKPVGTIEPAAVDTREDTTEPTPPTFSPERETQFRDWMTRNGQTKEAGQAVDDNFTGTDYDYRGFFDKNGPEFDVKKGQHFTDEFKLPNHKTFSNESRYAVGDNAAHAGHWEGEGPDAKFIPPAPKSKEQPAASRILSREPGEPTPPDPAAKPWVDTFKQVAAGLSSGTLGIAKSIMQTPHLVERYTRAGYNNLKDNGVPDSLNIFGFPNYVSFYLDKGFDVGGTHVGGFTDTADSIQRSMDILPNVSPTFAKMGSKGEEVDKAAADLLKGNTELMKKVAMDPEAWGAFIGQGLPTLFTAWRSGGSIPFMAWLEAMGQADNVEQYEKQTGSKISDNEFVASTAIVGSANAFLEKFGLESILGKVMGKTGLIGRFVEGTVGEGGTETLQQLVQNTSALLYDPDLQAKADDAIHAGQWEPFLADMSKQVLPSLMGGAGLGGAGAGIHATLTKAADLHEDLRTRNAEERVLRGDATPEQAADQGVEKVPVTYDLLNKVAQQSEGQELTPHEIYTITSEGLGWTGDDHRVFLNKKGADMRDGLAPETPQPEHITMEGEQYAIEPATIEKVEPDLHPRATFTLKTEDETKGEQRARMDRAANFAQTSERNDLPQPTQAQFEAGNYRKGHVNVQGLDIAIENPKGSVRAGKDWQQKMADHYGYIKGTVGKDKDHIDAFVGPNAYSQQVFVVNQNDGKGGFDEHKVMLGYTSVNDAQSAYHANYPEGWTGMESIVPMSMPAFKEWLGSGKTKQPIATQDPREQLTKQEPIETKPISTTELPQIRKTASRAYDDQAKEGSVLTSDGRKVELTNVGLKKTRSHSADRRVLDVLPQIRTIIENAVPLKTVARKVSGPGDNIRAYHHYAAKVAIDGKPHFVKVTLREDRNGKVIYYDNDVTENPIESAVTDKGFSLSQWFRQQAPVDEGLAKERFKKSRTPKTNDGQGLRADVVRAAVGVYAKYFNGAPNLEVIEGFEDLPEHLRQTVRDSDRGRITGVYDWGGITESVYLIGNNIDSIEQAVETLMHEYVGHYGLRSVVGGAYEETMDRVYANFADKVRDVAKVYGLDWTNTAERRVAVEEYIASLAQTMLNGRTLKQSAAAALKRVVDIIRELVAKVMGRDIMTERQVYELLQNAHDYVVSPSGLARDNQRGARRMMENPTYLSQMFKLVNDDSAKAMSPADWKRIIQAHVKNGRLKEEEVKWSGIEQFLDDANWEDAIGILERTMSVSTSVPKEIADAKKLFDETLRDREEVRDDLHSVRYNAQKYPDDKEMQKQVVDKHSEFLAASEVHEQAALKWVEFAKSTPKKLPKEVVLAHIEANGVDIDIVKNAGADAGSEPSFSESYPDETITVNDDGEEISGARGEGRQEEAKYEAYSEHLDQFWDTNSDEYESILADKYEENSDVFRIDEDGEKLSDAKYIEKVEEEEGERAVSGWKDEANDEYRELLDGEHSSEFEKRWDEEHTRYRWLTGNYEVMRSGSEGSFEVHNIDSGQYIGTFGDEDEANAAIKDDWLESAEGATKYADYTLPGGENYAEWLFKWNNPSKTLFTHGHWDGQENFVAHVRFDERFAENGAKAIFIDEIQSDWHQALRDRGAKDPQLADATRHKVWALQREYMDKDLQPMIADMKRWPMDPGIFLAIQNYFPREGQQLMSVKQMVVSAIDQMQRQQHWIDRTAAEWIGSTVSRNKFMMAAYAEHGGHNADQTNPRHPGYNANPDAADGTGSDVIADRAKVLAYQAAEEELAGFNKSDNNAVHITDSSWQTVVDNWEKQDEALNKIGADGIGSANAPSTQFKIGAFYAAIAPLIDKLQTEPGTRDLFDGEPLYQVGSRTDMDNRRVNAAHKIVRLAEMKSIFTQASDGIEQAPFGKTWQLLVIKGMIREAVDRGWKHVFMAPGEVHGIRWGGGGAVDGVEWRQAWVDQEEKDPATGKPKMDGNGGFVMKRVPGFEIYGLQPSTEDLDTEGGVSALSNFRPKQWSRTSGLPLEIPASKLAAGIGSEAARVINRKMQDYDAEDERTGQKALRTGRVTATEINRSHILVANINSDTLSGGREIYNVITPNIINKWIKKFGAEMKMGLVRLPSTASKAHIEDMGVDVTTRQKGPRGRRSTDDNANMMPRYTVRRLHESEIPSQKIHGYDSDKPHALFGAYNDNDGRLADDSVRSSAGHTAEWIRQQQTKYLQDYSAFGAWHIEITDELAAAAKQGFPLFMKKYPSKDLNNAITKAEKEIFPKRPSSVELMTKRAQSVVNMANKFAKFNQAFVDQFAGIKYALRAAHGGVDLPAEQSGYKQAHFTTSTDGQLYALLNHGMFQWSNGITQIKPGSKGLLQILEPVASHVTEWGYWMAATRANRLMKEGRENLFDQKTIDGLLELSKYHPEFVTVATEYAKWKAELLDWAQEAGVIDPITRGLWENADHVPFYRVKADELGGSFGVNSGISGGGGIVNQIQPIRRLKGGTQPLGDILENIIMNMTNIISTTMRNRAAALTIEGLANTDLVTPVKGTEFMHKEMIDMGDLKRKLKAAGVDPAAMPTDALNAMRQMWTVQPPTGSDIVSILVAGKKKYYHVNDDTLFRSLTAINVVRFNSTLAKVIMAPLRTAKSLLAHTITLAGGYMAANWLRDTPSQYVNSRFAKAPRFDRSVAGIKKAFNEDTEMVSIMAAGGSFYSGYVNAMNATATTKAMRRSLRRKGFKDSIIDSPAKLFDLYMRLGVAMENSNRIAQNYIPAIKAGQSVGDAVWESKDALNFAKHGDLALVQFLAQTVFTFNARIQGLVRTGQSFKEAPGRTALRALLYTVASLALYLAWKDDDRYKELSEDEKDLYHHAWIGDRHIRLPKAFELGTIFGTIPERMTEYFYSNEDDRGRLAIDRAKFIFNQVFQLWDPVTVVPAPNLVQPEIERRFNYDFFTRGRIIPDYMAEMSKAAPELTYNEQTSPTVRELVKYSPNFVAPDFRNPMMVQHLIEGYTGTVGAQAIMLSDDLVRKVFDYPARPALAWSQLPLMSRFYRADEPPRRSKYEEVIYSVREAARGIDAAVKEMQDRDLPSEQIEAFENAPSTYGSGYTNQEVSDSAKAMKSSFKALSSIYKEVDEIWADPEMPPAEKLNQLNRLYREKSDEAREAYGERPGAAESSPTGQLIDNIRGLKPDDAADKLRAQQLNATASLVASLPRVTSTSFAKVLKDA